MKKILLFFGLFSMMICFSCEKESLRDYWGFVEALKNGESWEASIIALPNLPHDQGFDLLIDKFDENDVRSENLFIYKIPFREGTFEVTRSSVQEIDNKVGASFFNIAGGDGLEQVSRLSDLDSTSFITVSEIEDDEIRGTFQLTFFRDTSFRADPIRFPDTLIFTTGEFHTKLREHD